MNACVSPFEKLVGPSGLEPPTSCLSGTRSNLLSYEPMWLVSDLGHLNSVVTFTKWRFHFGLPKFHSLCEFHFDEVKISLRNYVSLVEMMGFDSRRELRGLVAVGSNSPPDCYSLPTLFESLLIMGRKSHWIRDFRPMVEMMGFEPMTPCLQGRCSPSWATPPY